jgi:hypothetical protein
MKSRQTEHCSFVHAGTVLKSLLHNHKLILNPKNSPNKSQMSVASLGKNKTMVNGRLKTNKPG